MYLDEIWKEFEIIKSEADVDMRKGNFKKILKENWKKIWRLFENKNR